MFTEAFADGHRKRWRLNHTPLFLDFLEGKVDYDCTPWGIPSYSILGWQKPCYLMADGYTKTYKELLDTTDWSKYGRGRDERCDNCLAHCGYEPTAVLGDDQVLEAVASRGGGHALGRKPATCFGQFRRPVRGAIAQLVERRLCKPEVRGSSPLSSTSSSDRQFSRFRCECYPPVDRRSGGSHTVRA